VLGVVLATAIGVLDARPGAAADGYRARHLNLADDLRRVELPWTSEPRLKLPARRPTDADGVPMFRCAKDGKRFYRPGALAINGMKRLDFFIEKGDPRQLEQATKQAAVLRRIALHRRRAWWLPVQCDHPPMNQRAPWFNAMIQGLGVMFFVRMYRVTNEQHYLDGARQFFRSFQRLDRRKGTWVSFVDDRRYLWLEHYPMRNPDHNINAHLHATFEPGAGPGA
jgi:hypothetical protein